jgi:hypothetical protein
MKLVLIILFGCCLTRSELYGQSRELSFSFFNNAVAMPFSGKAGIFHQPVHPGLTVGLGKSINKNEKHQLKLYYKFGYCFQKRVQHAVQLYPEITYRYVTKPGIGIETRLAAGYLHSFPDLQQFKLNSNGVYERYGRGGRPSGFGAFSLGFGYDLEKKLSMPVYVYLQYQVWFQGPFVRSYVPVLPNAALHLGASIRLRNK